MFDNIALNVTIGLVLIYLLYSLLVTILGEMISSWLGIRPRMLRMGISRMLNDGSNRQSRVERFLLQTPPGFELTFAGKFYEYPSIKYLTRLQKEEKWIFGQTKPAYISAENFAVTLINMFAEKGDGADKFAKVQFCLQFNTLRIEQETRSHLLTLLSNAGTDINRFKDLLEQWFNETMDRTNGWYKSRMKFISFWIGFLLALFFNVNTIGITRILASDKDARQQLVNMGIQLVKDSARYEAFTTVSNDSLHNRTLIDSGISRVTKDISYANMILGLGWGTDKLEKPQTQVLSPEDSTDIAAVNQLVQMSSGAHKLRSAALTGMKVKAKDLDSLQGDRFLARMNVALNEGKLRDAMQRKDTLQQKQATDSLDTWQRKLQALNNIVAKDSISFKEDSLLLVKGNTNLREMRMFAERFLKTPFRRIDSFYVVSKKPKEVIAAGAIAYDAREKAAYIYLQLMKPENMAGLFLTALALSLGAPFWFDLLKKLVSIRGVGVKPEEKPAAETVKVNMQNTPAAPIPPVLSDVVEKAMLLHAGNIKSIAGVQSVFPVFSKQPASRFIQVNVDSVATQQVVMAAFSPLLVDNTPVTVNVVVTGTARQHGSPRIISNQHRIDTLGSLGCILQGRDGKHLISCFHVLNGTTQYDKKDQFFNILDSNKRLLGQRDAGGISGSFDYGLAKIFSDRNVDNEGLFKTLGITRSECRPVSNDDLLDQVPVLFLDIHSGMKKTGFLYTITPAYTIKYEDTNRQLTNLLVLTASLSGHATISREGNSGAIIFKEDGSAIGMIVAGDSQYTYAMQLSGVFDIHKELTIVN